MVVSEERSEPTGKSEPPQATPLQSVAEQIGTPLRWISGKSPDLVARAIVHAHRPLVGDRYVEITHRVKGYNSFKIMVNPQDNCGGRLYYWGNYEPSQTAAFTGLLSELEPNAFVDIGANIGYYSLLSAANGVGNVISVEASPGIFAMLGRSVSLNPSVSGNVQLMPVAASDHEGEITFWVNKAQHNFGLGSVIRNEEHPGEAVNVPCRPADTFLSDLSQGPVLCKVDVEGAELLVLRGMMGTIERIHPTFLLEVHPTELAHLGHTQVQVIQFLWDRGYKVAELDGFKEVPITDLASLPSDNFCVVARFSTQS